VLNLVEICYNSFRFYLAVNDFELIGFPRSKLLPNSFNIVLKVIAGDSYNFWVASCWSSDSSATNNTTNVLNDLLLAISNSVAGVSQGKVSSTEVNDWVAY